MKKLYFGGPILTMDRDCPTAEAVLTENGKILAVGDYADLVCAGIEKCDLQGNTVFVSYLKSSISMKYNIHKNPALVFHIDKKHIKLHISPLKASNNVRDMLVSILLPVLKAFKSVSEF